MTNCDKEQEEREKEEKRIFGRMVYEVRKVHMNKRQGEFGEKYGASQQVVSGWERGANWPEKKRIIDEIKQLHEYYTSKGTVQEQQEQRQQEHGKVTPTPEAIEQTITQAAWHRHCAITMEILFDFIGESYGRDSVAIHLFLADQERINEKYRDWLIQKKPQSFCAEVRSVM